MCFRKLPCVVALKTQRLQYWTFFYISIVIIPSRETMIDHLEIESSIISRNSNEGKRQLERELEKGEGSLQERSWGENEKYFDYLLFRQQKIAENEAEKDRRR